MVSDGYDNEALRFFVKSAERLVPFLDLKGDEQVLDVATGTGHAALPLAMSLTGGRVTGIDFSRGMLDIARHKATQQNIRNVEFLEMDMQALAFPEGYFDAAVCSFGIFFVEDMHEQLMRIASKVKAGGKIAITCFHEDYLKPQVDMLIARLLSYGVKVPKQAQSFKKIATEEKCRCFMKSAGLKNIEVELENVGYFLGDAEEWWDVVWNAGMRRLITQLPPGELERFKQEHLQEVDELKTEDGIWLDVDVLFAIGNS